MADPAAHAADTADTAGRFAPTPAERAVRVATRRFVAERIAPFADGWERADGFPLELIGELRRAGLLGAPLPTEVGGRGLGAIAYGLLTEEVGRGCSSVRSLLTVHDMTSLTVERWGSPALKDELLTALAKGERLAAFALSEPEVGSDAAAVATTAVPVVGAGGQIDGYRLTGTKKWTTCGRIADLFLVVARSEQGPLALLVDADSPGLSRRPLVGIAGTGASHLAELTFTDCFVPVGRRLGRAGFGFTLVAGTTLDHGRYSVAWGAVGIAQACLDAALDYTRRREQGGKPLVEHQLVRRKLTEMIAGVRSARLLCYRAGALRQGGEPAALGETQVAKYFAARVAARAADDAVQLHGANGLSPDYPVGRYQRDAKVTEIIEGSNQIHQITIPDALLDEL